MGVTSTIKDISPPPISKHVCGFFLAYAPPTPRIPPSHPSLPATPPSRSPLCLPISPFVFCFFFCFFDRLEGKLQRPLLLHPRTSLELSQLWLYPILFFLFFISFNIFFHFSPVFIFCFIFRHNKILSRSMEEDTHSSTPS